MNPAWFTVGVQIGERLSPVLRPILLRHGKRLVREAYWLADKHAGPIASRIAYRRWVRSLP